MARSVLRVSLIVEFLRGKGSDNVVWANEQRGRGYTYYRWSLNPVCW